MYYECTIGMADRTSNVTYSMVEISCFRYDGDEMIVNTAPAHRLKYKLHSFDAFVSIEL